MAKKNFKVDIDTENVDLKVERKDDNLNVDYDSKKIDVKVNKTANEVEVKVDAKGGLLTFVGNILKKVLLRKLK
jgi:hypothetical protein